MISSWRKSGSEQSLNSNLFGQLGHKYLNLQKTDELFVINNCPGRQFSAPDFFLNHMWRNVTIVGV